MNVQKHSFILSPSAFQGEIPIKLSDLGINKKSKVAPESELYVKLKAFLKGDSFFHFCVTLSLKLSVTLLPPSLPLLDSDPPIS